MKNIRSKSLLTLIIIFFIIGFTTSAKNIIGFTGDSNYSDSTLDSSSMAKTLVRNPARVVFPVVLSEHREESKDYVKQYSRKQRDYIIYMFSRGKNYFPKAAKIFTEYDVPLELQVLPALESNFRSDAVSKAGAVGYWQFMSELAHDYGLSTGKYDERKNFTKSTIAAAKFFRDQLDYFDNDLLLAVAAYNCGTGGVRSAIKKSNVSEPDFWDIKKFLPTETRIFVMKFISLNVISANYNKFIHHKLNFNEPTLVQLALVDSSNADRNDVAQNPL
ncbi:MAG: lytic transglycosylase domain-containing protein [Ginsengibacter sp.]